MTRPQTARFERSDDGSFSAGRGGSTSPLDPLESGREDLLRADLPRLGLAISMQILSKSE